MYRRVAVVGRGALAVPRVRYAQRPYSQRPNPDEDPEEEVERPRSRRTINTNLLSTLGAKPAEAPKPAPPPPPQVQPAAKQTTAAQRAPPTAPEPVPRPQSAKPAPPAAQQQQSAQAKKPASAAQLAPAAAKAAQPQQASQAKGPVDKKLIDTLAAAQKASQSVQKQTPKAAAAQQTNTARTGAAQKSDAKAAPVPAPKQQQQPAKTSAPQQAKVTQNKAAQPKQPPVRAKPAAEQHSQAAQLKQAAAAARQQAAAPKATPPPKADAKARAATTETSTQVNTKPEVAAEPIPSAEPVKAETTPVSSDASSARAAESDAQPAQAAAKVDEYQPIGPTTKMPEESAAPEEPRGKSPRAIFEEFMKNYTGPRVLVEDLQVQEPDPRNPLVELELDHLAQSVQRDVMNAGWSPTLAHLQPAVIRKIAMRIAQREGKTKHLPKYVQRMSGFMHMAGARHAPRYPNDRPKPLRSAEGAREKLWRAQVRRPDGWRLRAETVAAIALPPNLVKLRHQGELETDMLGYLRMRRNRKEWRAEVAGGDYKRFIAHVPVPDALDASSSQGQAQLAVRSAFLALQHNTTITLKKKRAAREAYRELVKGEKGATRVRVPQLKEATTKINIEAVVDIVAPLTALELPDYADQFTEETHPSRLR
ncbi:hypothetical protein AURDEDRAFT_110192 [Auricularia subglabra TFB-10046 SS5]|nr:hypothetical protein AURDEDRAFT_110192 [Auricularia subglabra TFB-10046 SS5]